MCLSLSGSGLVMNMFLSSQADIENLSIEEHRLDEQIRLSSEALTTPRIMFV